MALLLSLLSPGVVASATAQQVAPVYAVGRQVADAIPSAEGTSLGIGIAKIRRAFVINQIALCGGFEVVVLGSQRLHPTSRLLVLLHHHFRRAVVLVLHVVTDNSKVRLRPPACLDFAAPREPVALALQKHVVVKRLLV